MVQDMNRHNSYISSSDNKGDGKKPVRRFAFSLTVFLLLIILYINYILPQYDGEYNSGLIDKVKRLEAIDEPKIVLLGNSNLSFGMDSQRLENAMGMPVVNMGLHGGLGNALHEEMVRLNVTEGDIYIVCHTEYADDDGILDKMCAWTSIENHYELWRILRFSDIPAMAESFPVYMKKCLERYASDTGNIDNCGVYSRSGFNEYGDVGIYRYSLCYNFEDMVAPPNINDITTERLNRLSEYLEERGATLLVAAYPIANGENTVDAQEYISFQSELEDRLDCPVISNYADYMYDYSYFFDTVYHLTNDGAELRTAQLIKDLGRWQQTGEDASLENDEYEDIIADVNLSHIAEPDEYRDALAGAASRYTICVPVEGSIAESTDKGTGKTVKDEAERLIQELGAGSDTMLNIQVKYVQADEKDKAYDSEDRDGVNMYIYSNETDRILDRFTLDDSSGELTMSR